MDIKPSPTLTGLIDKSAYYDKITSINFIQNNLNKRK